MYSLEYCHLTSGRGEEEVIAQANARMPDILRAYEGREIRTCMMIDDLRRKTPFTPGEVDAITSRLTVKPDCVFLESAFVPVAKVLIDRMSGDVVQQYTFDEHHWLRSVEDRYLAIQEFLVGKEEGGSISFSCPTLVATSYAFRLGLLGEQSVAPIVGTFAQADRLINVLPSKYLAVEANAQLLLRAAFPEALPKVEWHFLP